jgi:hypothetical protein
MAKKKGKFIQKAIKHPGALRAKAKKAHAINPKTGKIDKSWIDKEAHSKNLETKRQAVLAKTLLKMNKKR